MKKYLSLIQLFSVSILSVGVFSSCTNNLNVSSVLSSIQASTPTSGTGTNSLGTFILSRVVKNNLDPSGTLDLIGDGSGTFGQQCQATSASGGSGNTCSCTYAYSSPTVPSQSVDVPVIYSETNLVRCNYSAVATDVTQMTVSLHQTVLDIYSSQVTFNFAGTSITLDTSQISSFVQPIRYQCKDILVNLNYLFDNIYDPIQSEDYRLTYPLDFYYTNPGGNLSTYISSQTSNYYWDCPPVMNPSVAFSSASSLLNYESEYHVNLQIYSSSPLTVGDSSSQYVIYPPPAHPLQNGNIDRSTFYLAKAASGVFSVPVDAYVAPGVDTSPTATASSSSGVPPLGYGASPISTNDGQETCPDSSVAIPAGYHWVKVWLFRSALSPRYITVPGPRGSGPNQGSSVFDLSGIFCNIGDWTPDGTTALPNLSISPVFGGCPRDIIDYGLDGDGNSSGNSGGYYAAALSTVSINATNTLLADRYLETGECVRLDEISGAAGAAYENNYKNSTKASNCGNNPGLNCGSEGQDYWGTWVLDSPTSSDPTDAVFTYSQVSSTSPTGYPSALNVGCNATTVYDPFDVCSYILPPQTKNVASAGAPVSNNVTTQSIDSGSNRYDFLFVVSPTNIMQTDMTQLTTAAGPYQPYRFQTDLDCIDPLTGEPSTDPTATNAAHPTLCQTTSLVSAYSLKLDDVGANNNASANNPNPGVFPVCAIQPN